MWFPLALYAYLRSLPAHGTLYGSQRNDFGIDLWLRRWITK
jgi:hypothetical protein